MRILAVDARHRCDPDRILEVAAAVSPSRVFLFGAAARDVARAVRKERDALDEQFIDDTARFLVDGAKGDRPRRGALAPVIQRFLTVYPQPTTTDLLPSTDRAVEIRGRFLVMAVASKSALDGETLENATAWIVGGLDEVLVETQGSTPVLGPGAIDEDGRFLIVEAAGAGLVVETRLADGTVERREPLQSMVTARFSVSNSS